MKVTNPPKPRPVMLYDGDSAFMRREAFFLRGTTRQQVDFADYHRAAPRFPQIDISYMAQEIKLIAPSGYVYGGAEAVFKALSYGGNWKWLWPIYNHVAPFRWITEMIYRHIERRKDVYSRRVGPFWFEWNSGGEPYEIGPGRSRKDQPVRRNLFLTK